MILQKPLVGECLQCVKQPTNTVDKNTVNVVRTNVLTVKKRWLAICKISMIVSMFLSQSHWALDVFTTGRRVNRGCEYGLQFHATFHFYRLEKPLNWLKNKIGQIEESLNETVKRPR